MSRLVASQRAWLAPSWVREDLSRKAQALPSLDLRFAESKSLTDAASGQSLVTFTRASSGTYVGSDGVLKTATTNLLLRSEEFDNAQWVKRGTCTVVANDAIAPNGTLTADKVTFAGSGNDIYYGSLNIAAGATISPSIYIKKITASGTFTLQSANGAANGSWSVNLSLLSTSWERLTATHPAVTVGTAFTGSGNSFSGVQLYQSSGTLTELHLWGAQLEQSSTVGEYIPTTSTINSAPRFDHSPTTGESLGLLVEEQRTNSIRNNTMVGAVAGTPGTLPTNWVIGGSGIGTLTQQVVGVGTTGSLAYIDIRFSGTTSTTNFRVNFEPNTQVAAASGQNWTASVYTAVVAGSTSNITSVQCGITERSNTGTFLDESASVVNTASSIARTVHSRTFNQATTAFCNSFVTFNFSSGVAIDITIRIGLPQLEQGAFATSVIPTSGTTATRSADVASITGANFSSWYRQDEGTVFAEGAAQRAVEPAGAFLELNDTTASNQVDIRQYRQDPFVCGGGSANVTWSVEAQGTINPNVVYRQAVGYSPSSHGSAISGVVRTSSSAIGPIAATRLAMFMRDAQTSPSGGTGGTIRRLTYWPTRLPNSTLQTLTQ